MHTKTSPKGVENICKCKLLIENNNVKKNKVEYWHVIKTLIILYSAATLFSILCKNSPTQLRISERTNQTSIQIQVSIH